GRVVSALFRPSNFNTAHSCPLLVATQALNHELGVLIVLLITMPQRIPYLLQAVPVEFVDCGHRLQFTLFNLPLAVRVIKNHLDSYKPTKCLPVSDPVAEILKHLSGG